MIRYLLRKYSIEESQDIYISHCNQLHVISEDLDKDNIINNLELDIRINNKKYEINVDEIEIKEPN